MLDQMQPMCSLDEETLNCPIPKGLLNKLVILGKTVKDKKNYNKQKKLLKTTVVTLILIFF